MLFYIFVAKCVAMLVVLIAVAYLIGLKFIKNVPEEE